MAETTADEATAVLVLDPALRIEDASDHAAALLGYGPALLATTADRIVGFNADWLRQEVQALSRYGTWRGDVALRHKDGRLLHVMADIVYVATPAGDRIVVTFVPR